MEIGALVQLDIRDSWREARNPLLHIWQRIGVKRSLRLHIRRQSGNEYRARRYMRLFLYYSGC
jgi:hypothetical protein